MRIVLLPLAALLSLAACTMPETTVRRTDHRPSLAVQGAPAGAVLFVDGERLGEANVVNGQPKVVRVEPGTHAVELRDASGNVLHHQTVFVESELETIQVH